MIAFWLQEKHKVLFKYELTVYAHQIFYIFIFKIMQLFLSEN